MATDFAAPTQETVDRLAQEWLMLWNGSASDTPAAISPSSGCTPRCSMAVTAARSPAVMRLFPSPSRRSARRPASTVIERGSCAHHGFRRLREGGPSGGLGDTPARPPGSRVRSQPKPVRRPGGSHRCQGEVADTAAVHAALAGSDAVISTLGGWGKTSSDVLATGMTTIIPAMQALHLTRIVTLTGAGARWAGDRSSLRLAVNRAALTMMKAPALRDAEKHLDILARSSLDWTSVRAPGISAEGPDGYRLDTKLPSLLTTIPGPAVARSLIDLAERPEFHRQAPGIHRA